jgi:hypothetical protein
MARTGYLGGSDAAVIVARKHNFITQGIKVELAAAKSLHFGATGGQHAAHAVKRYTFDGKDIAEVYTRKGLDEVALIGLRTMLGLAIDVDRRANLSIEKRIDPVLSALHSCRGWWTPRSAALPKCGSWRAISNSIAACPSPRCCSPCEAVFAGGANYNAMLTEYMTIRSTPPPRDESPELMVDMISRLIDS